MAEGGAGVVGERLRAKRNIILQSFILIIAAENIVKGDFYVVAHKEKSKDNLSDVKNSNLCDKCRWRAADDNKNAKIQKKAENKLEV